MMCVQWNVWAISVVCTKPACVCLVPAIVVFTDLRNEQFDVTMIDGNDRKIIN